MNHPLVAGHGYSPLVHKQGIVSQGLGKPPEVRRASGRGRSGGCQRVMMQHIATADEVERVWFQVVGQNVSLSTFDAGFV